ncbi:hypothetical protein BA022_07345 [Diaphorobacter nitroreducens]|nr:hypothetical protein BA022_07345 [Diaphorobacter nitroreducens]OJV60754.1 MAG: hypothetical protein BGO36_12690 [Burkholderiales bacterium 68-10]
MRFFVVIEFAGEQVHLIACGDRCGDRQYPRPRLSRQNDLVNIFVLLGLELFTGNFEFDLGVCHRGVVSGTVKIEGDVLAVEHADKFEDVGDGDEPWERGASSGRGRVAVVMAFASARQRRQEKGRGDAEHRQ